MIHIPYRNLMGMILEMLDGEKMPHYTAIFRRIQSLDVQRNGRIITVADSKDVAIRFAVDSTGLKQHNRGGMDTAKVAGKTRICKAAHFGGRGYKKRYWQSVSLMTGREILLQVPVRQPRHRFYHRQSRKQ